MEIDESEGGREGVGDGADAACPCIPGPRGPPLRPRPNNVNDKADKAATMQPTSCYVTLTTSGEACLIKKTGPGLKFKHAHKHEEAQYLLLIR